MATGCVFSPVNTNDNNICTTDGCDPALGVTHSPVNPTDNNACTTDACDPVNGITHTPAPFVPVADGNNCTADVCNPATGGTMYTPINPCCEHSQCITGNKLDAASCSWGAGQDCATKICALDSFCCNNSWDGACAAHPKDAAYCSPVFTCTCAHSYCTVGTLLAAQCDPCVKAICAVDPFCCNNSWDSACVSETNTVCHIPVGAGCK